MVYTTLVKVTQCHYLCLHCTTLSVARCGAPVLLGSSSLVSQEMEVGVIAWKLGGDGRERDRDIRSFSQNVQVTVSVSAFVWCLLWVCTHVCVCV